MTRILPTQPSATLLHRWLLGTAAVGASAAQAEIVQIDLVGNEASVASRVLDDDTYRDLTGDGIDDLVGSSALSFRVARGLDGIDGVIASYRVGARVTSSTSSSSSFTSTTFTAFVGKATFNSDDDPVSARAFIPVTFTDARINGGAATNGLIEVLAVNHSLHSHSIRLVRLVFDDESTDEPSGVLVSSQFAPWADIIAQSGPGKKPLSNVAKKRLKAQIAALEALIKKTRATAKPTSPRLNFYRMSPATIQLIAKLERRLAALKRALARL